MRKVSEVLKQAREEKGVSLSQVEQDTKIKKVYLEAIERGEFLSLPSENYALGFVKNYAKYLDLPVSSVVPLFRREYKSKAVSIVPEFRKTQHKFNKKFLFGTRGLIISFIGIILVVYIFFQYNSVIFPPKLDVETPKNGQVISGNVIEVKGKADPYSTVLVDGDEAYVDLSGEFSKSIYGFSGNKKITIVAKNRFGKQSQKIINVKVE